MQIPQFFGLWIEYLIIQSLAVLILSSAIRRNWINKQMLTSVSQKGKCEWLASDLDVHS